MTLKEALSENAKLTKQYNELANNYNIVASVVKYLMGANILKFLKWKKQVNKQTNK